MIRKETKNQEWGKRLQIKWEDCAQHLKEKAMYVNKNSIYDLCTFKPSTHNLLLNFYSFMISRLAESIYAWCTSLGRIPSRCIILLQRYLLNHVHCFNNSQKLERSQMSLNKKWTKKMFYIYTIYSVTKNKMKWKKSKMKKSWNP